MRYLVFAIAVAAAACNGTTGSHLSTWSAVASGPSGATEPFTTRKGATIELTEASLYVGAVYFNEVNQNSGTGVQPCISPGTYAGEVFGGLTVDLLSDAPQPFPSEGEGTENPALVAQVWLTGGDVNASNDPTVIFDVAGTATLGAVTNPFSGRVTIGENRAVAPTNTAEPGSSPICLQRIVTPIIVNLVLKQGGTMAMTVDPRVILDDVDFSDLAASQFVIPDTNVGSGGALFRGLQRVTNVYAFTFTDAP